MPELSLALLAILPLAAVELAKAARWRVLFGQHRPSYAVCLRALVLGQITNALSPLRAGEAVRLGALKAQGAALVPGAGALAGEKAIDAVCLGAIAFSVAGMSIFSRSSLGLLAGFLVVLTGIALALRGQSLRPLLERNTFTRRLRLSALLDVAEALRDPRTLAAVVAMTLVVWTAGLAANLIVLAANGVPADLNLAARVIVAGYLVNLLPSPPAQIGTFEAGVTVALTSAGVPLPTALAAAISLHIGYLAKLALLFGVSALLMLPQTRWLRRTA